MTTTGAYTRGGVRNRYYLTRDSSPDGTLSATVDVWLTAPLRHRITHEGGYVWVPADARTYRTENHGRALFCALSLVACAARFGTVPSSDNVSLLLAEVAS